MTSFERAMAQLPLVAILRGMQPQEAVDLGEALVAMGFALIEVPLNSPEALDSIDRLVGCCGDRALIGAGTVLRSEEVAAVAATGARLIVAPNADPAVIAAAKAHGMVCLPGVATPSEAFRALAAGADGLKAFPAEALPPAAIKAWRAVLPPATPIVPPVPRASAWARRSTDPATGRPNSPSARSPSSRPGRSSPEACVGAPKGAPFACA